MNNSNTREKKTFITLINSAACIAVVFLHTNGCFWDFSTEGYWKTANIIESLLYFSVPCFYMITGATLMDFLDRYSLKEFFQKRIKKTVIPFLFWSMTGMIRNAVLYGSYPQNLLDIYNGIADTSYVSIYWFFPALFCLYLSLPLFAAVEKSKRKEIFTYLATAGFVINLVIPFIRTVTHLEISWPLSVSVVSGSLIWLVIGYLLAHYEMAPSVRKLIYCAAVLGFLLHCGGTYYLSMQAGEVVRTFKGYTSVPCMMYSVGIFVWLKYHSDRIMSSRLVSTVVNFIAPYSFGIYLLQFFIYSTMISVFRIDVRSMLYRLGAPFIIIPAAILIISVSRKIPAVRNIVP